MLLKGPGRDTAVCGGGTWGPPSGRSSLKALGAPWLGVGGWKGSGSSHN